MAAGLGFKTFTTGEVLTSADTNGYLMQGILVFATSTARDAAITSPQEGQFAYLKDTNTTTYYTGSAWTNLDTTGMVNPMTTTGDTIYSSSGSTPARLGIGTSGQVLTVSGAGVPSWATASGGGMTSLATGSLSGASVTLSSISATYQELYLVIRNFIPATDEAVLNIRFNSDSGANYGAVSSLNTTASFTNTEGSVIETTSNSSNEGIAVISIPQYTNTATRKIYESRSLTRLTSGNYYWRVYNGFYNSLSAISSITLLASTGNLTSGTYTLYGVK